ncbi:AAA family ATPase [Streptomyces sp. RS2]|uniref:helix-turn-helix transcriptional regulator n=1 Tax=Streptomyces sp. RS2 TaxID=1451205 RepID=UPI0021F890A2|nr:LuxR family transcriptional regulator [Streptomyces sp. RS2]MCW1097429.1 AAA family ATPase [Streptomyces sp. RS2]
MTQLKRRGLFSLDLLIERKDEISALRGLISDGRAGNGRITVVSGATGSGKTALLQQAAECAVEQGSVAVNVTCSPLERDVPLAVVRQLFDALPLGPQPARQVADMLAEGVQAGLGEIVTTITPAHARVAEALWGLLVAFSERTPVVVLIDDVRNSDALSLVYLLYFIRRVRPTCIAMVLSDTEDPQPRFPLFRAEIMRLPELSHIRTAALSPTGVTELLAGRVRADKAGLLGAEFHNVSGGSPLLLKSLLRDLADSASTPPEQCAPVVGEHFAQAVVSCLRRSGPTMLVVAQWVALLGDSTCKELLAECLGTSPESAHRLLRMLDTIGVTRAGRFRHPAARVAIMDGISEQNRAEMKFRVARMLYDTGAPATQVAGHLLGQAGQQAGLCTEQAAWAVSVLREAADRALTGNRVEQAIAWLRQAHRLCTDKAERGAVLFHLARIQWRHSPTAALRCLDQVTKPFVHERFGTPYTLLLIRYLLRSGRHQEAQKILHRLHRDADSLPDEVCAELRLLEMWLAVSFPAVAEHFPYDHSLVVRRSGPVTGRDELQWQAARLLVGVLGGGVDGGFISEVEQALRLYQVAEATLEPLVMGLSALIFADRLAGAGSWCASLMDDVETLDAPAWRAALSALRAEIAVRQGDLKGAVRLAEQALDDIDAEGWGVEIGVPLSTMVLAHVAMGRTEEANALLQLPAADPMHESRYGLQYRYARAHHHLAADRPHAALRDFLDCGTLMRRWNLDAPGLALWRVGAAEALLLLGEQARAKSLMDEQWALLAGKRTTRSAGMALRVCAAVTRPDRRPALLRQSAEILQGCGDRYELAKTMADLAHAHEALGESARARHAARKALRLAQVCGAAGIVARCLPAQGAEPVAETGRRPEPEASAAPQGEGINELSRAESKVAALASMGYSNREISDRLHVTISTVEQHLTRVYRKLRVNSREDLPTASLQPAVSF